MRMLNPPHPGEFVMTEVIEPLELTVARAATVLGVSRPTLSAFLNGRSDLSGNMALRIEKAFGVKMDTLMRMQASFDCRPAGAKGKSESPATFRTTRGSPLDARRKGATGPTSAAHCPSAALACPRQESPRDSGHPAVARPCLRDTVTHAGQLGARTEPVRPASRPRRSALPRPAGTTRRLTPLQVISRDHARRPARGRAVAAGPPRHHAGQLSGSTADRSASRR